MSSLDRPRYRIEVGVWVALVALLLCSLGSAYVPMGIGNVIASMGMATAKTLLVAVFFMHLRRASTIIRLAAGAGLLWVGLLFALTFADVFSRGPAGPAQP